MASTRFVIGFVATAASAVIALVACSSGTTSTGGGDGGASSSGSSGASSGSTSKLKSCPSADSTCTEAESEAYGNCFIEKCNDDLVKCYGPSYKDGTFAGACGPYITCTQACACGDSACLTKCAAPTAECTTCIQSFATSCTAKCPAPACASAGSSGSSGTSGGGGSAKSCADLAACCAAIDDAAQKKSCQDTYEVVKSSEQSCDAAYGSYAPSCPGG